jgi:hypothetical protein
MANEPSLGPVVNVQPDVVQPVVTEQKAAWVDMPEPVAKMPETYDPQKRTFIKKDQIKLCPTCGQPVTLPGKRMTGAMSVYVNPDTGKDILTTADNAETLEVNGVKLVRKDLWKAKV